MHVVLLFTAFNNRLIANVTALTPLGAIGSPRERSLALNASQQTT